MHAHPESAAARVGRGRDALSGQEHALAHAQFVQGEVLLRHQAQDRRRLRLARALIGTLPALVGHARREQHERTHGEAVARSPQVAKKPKRKNHGRALRASELAWREVFATVPRDNIELARLQNAWPRLVPRHLQEVAWPAWLTEGRLLIHVDDNQWLHELTYMRQDLLGKLRRACPTAGLRDLRLRVGEVEIVPRPEPVPEPKIPGLPLEPERATIDAMEAIEDATLRDAVATARLALGSR